MEILIELVLIGLASWRITNLLINEDGPFEIFEKLRNFAGVREGVIEGTLPKLFTCIYCMSVWTTILAYFAYQLSPTLVMIVAAMSFVIAVNSLIEKD